MCGQDAAFSLHFPCNGPPRPRKSPFSPGQTTHCTAGLSAALGAAALGPHPSNAPRTARAGPPI